MSREHIAKVLKELRLKSGLTAKEVGDMIGKSGKTVSAWENNHGQPDAELLIALCDIYEVDDILKAFREDDVETIALSEHEKTVIVAYRNKPEMQPAVDKLLGIVDDKMVALPMAARSIDNRPVGIEYISKEKLAMLNENNSVKDEDDL